MAAKSDAKDVRRITKDSNLEDISVGKTVELVGISDEDQREIALVGYYDPVARLIGVVNRKSPEEIQLTSYFITPYGVKKARNLILVSGIDKEFPAFDLDLREVGL